VPGSRYAAFWLCRGKSLDGFTNTLRRTRRRGGNRRWQPHRKSASLQTACPFSTQRVARRYSFSFETRSSWVEAGRTFRVRVTPGRRPDSLGADPGGMSRIAPKTGTQKRSQRVTHGIHGARGPRRNETPGPARDFSVWRAKEMVDRGRIELPTARFSGPCSSSRQTAWKPGPNFRAMSDPDGYYAHGHTGSSGLLSCSASSGRPGYRWHPGWHFFLAAFGSTPAVRIAPFRSHFRRMILPQRIACFQIFI
jgi:hypothetical protein